MMPSTTDAIKPASMQLCGLLDLPNKLRVWAQRPRFMDQYCVFMPAYVHTYICMHTCVLILVNPLNIRM